MNFAKLYLQVLVALGLKKMKVSNYAMRDIIATKAMKTAMFVQMDSSVLLELKKAPIFRIVVHLVASALPVNKLSVQQANTVF
jgi:hypothetical protein